MPDGGALHIVVEPLHADHQRGEFDCGQDALTSFCTNRALIAHRDYDVRVFVAVEPGSTRVLGFYSLTIRHIKGGGRLAHLPAVYLAMVGVCENWKRKQIGTQLIDDAFKRCVRVSEDVGAHYLWLNAITDDNKIFYAGLGFEEFRSGDMRMRIHLQTLRASEV